jgi:hypothetical protein
MFTHQSADLDFLQLLGILMDLEEIVLYVEIYLQPDAITKRCCHS